MVCSKVGISIRVNHESNELTVYPSDGQTDRYDLVLKVSQRASHTLDEYTRMLEEQFSQLGCEMRSFSCKKSYRGPQLEHLKFTFEPEDKDFSFKVASIFHSFFPECITEDELNQFKMLQRTEDTQTTLHAYQHPEQKSIDFVRRIKKDAWQIVLEKLRTMDFCLSDDSLLAFIEGKWMADVFSNPDWPYLALDAHLTNKIGINEIAKLFLFDECQRSPTFVCHQIILNGAQAVDPTAWRLFERGLHDLFSPQEKDQILSQLKTTAPHESQFFCIVTPEIPIERATVSSEVPDTLPQNILEFIVLYSNFKLFIVQESDCVKQLIVPPGLCHTVMQAKFGKTTMKPNPVLGYFHKERLSDPDRRVVAIPSRFNSLQENIHEVKASALSHYHHDAAYHLFLESGNVHRKAWIELALALKDQNVRALILDRELPLYSRPEVRISIAGSNQLCHEEIFWISCAMLLFRITHQYQDISLSKQTIKQIIAYIKEHKDDWNHKYSITLEGLQKSCERYQSILKESGLTLDDFCQEADNEHLA